jgi:hypothetical protein
MFKYWWYVHHSWVSNISSLPFLFGMLIPDVQIARVKPTSRQEDVRFADGKRLSIQPMVTEIAKVWLSTNFVV